MTTTTENMLPADADPAQTQMPTPPEATPAEQVKKTFIQRCLEILEDDGIELNDKIKKIKDILKAAEEAAKLMDDAARSESTPVKESQEPVEDRRWLAFQLLESKGITPTTALVNSLAKLTTQDDMASVLSVLPQPAAKPHSATTAPAKPRAVETVLEHQVPNRTTKLSVNPQDNAAVAKFLRGS